MTEAQRERLAELVAKNKASAREKEISRVKTQMADEIAFFSERYVFADAAESEKLSAFVDALPFSRPGWVDDERFARRRVYSPEEVDGRRVWIYFLSGSEEIFDIFVGGTVSDFLWIWTSGNSTARSSCWRLTISADLYLLTTTKI